jgi:hypothetical protein
MVYIWLSGSTFLTYVSFFCQPISVLDYLPVGNSVIIRKLIKEFLKSER